MIFRDVIKLGTKKDGFYELGKQISKIIEESGAKDGLCHVFVKGTTAGLLIKENDRMLVEDFRKTLAALIPEDHIYQHPDNAHSHLRSALLNNSLTIPISDGKLLLGTWQSVLLFELDVSDRERGIVITVTGA